MDTKDMIGYKDCPTSIKYALEKNMCQPRLTSRAHIQQTSTCTKANLPYT